MFGPNAGISEWVKVCSLGAVDVGGMFLAAPGMVGVVHPQVGLPHPAHLTYYQHSAWGAMVTIDRGSTYNHPDTCFILTTNQNTCNTTIYIHFPPGN